jgi:hypothetical protein
VPDQASPSGVHPFLSDEWIAAARAIHAELRPEGVEGEPVDLRVNVVVTAMPFGDSRMHGHLDAADGGLDIEVGHLPEPHATVTLDYDTARALVVDRDTQALTRAFMSGRLTVEGDLAKLLALAARPVSGGAGDAVERIRAITA